MLHQILPQPPKLLLILRAQFLLRGQRLVRLLILASKPCYRLRIVPAGCVTTARLSRGDDQFALGLVVRVADRDFSQMKM